MKENSIRMVKGGYSHVSADGEYYCLLDGIESFMKKNVELGCASQEEFM